MHKNLAATFVAACCFLSAPQGAFSQTSSVKDAPGAEPLKVGFVYVAPLTPAGWVHQHELGRQAVDAALGKQVQTTFVENVAEGRTPSA